MTPTRAVSLLLLAWTLVLSIQALATPGPAERAARGLPDSILVERWASVLIVGLVAVILALNSNGKGKHEKQTHYGDADRSSPARVDRHGLGAAPRPEGTDEPANRLGND